MGLSSARIWAGAPVSKGWLASSWAGEMAGLDRWAAGVGTKKLPGGLATAADGAEGTSGGSMGKGALHTSQATFTHVH